MYDKIKKLVRLYKSDPLSHEGQVAYRKASDLIVKHGFTRREFDFDYSIVELKNDYSLVAKPKPFVKKISKVVKNKLNSTTKNVVNSARDFFEKDESPRYLPTKYEPIEPPRQYQPEPIQYLQELYQPIQQYYQPQPKTRTTITIVHETY